MLGNLLKKEDVLGSVQMKGPLIPVHLVGLLKSNTIMIGAALSELVSDGAVRISHMKVGGSPLYYVDEQRAKLQDFYKYLNEKDRRTFDLLKQQKVLRDSEVTPLLRVSLRNIKDFSVPMEIEYNNSKVLFWRWYLVEKQESVQLIRSLLGLQAAKKVVEPEQIATVQKEKLADKEQKQDQMLKTVVQPAQKIKKKAAATAVEKEQKQQLQQLQQEQFIQPTVEQTTLLTAQHLLETSEDALLQKCNVFFDQKTLRVKELTIVKKEKEFVAIVSIPTVIGEVVYYCCAKQKKKVTENELAAIYLEAQNKKLPAMVLVQGEYTKKAYEKVAGQFVNMKLLQL